VASRIGRARSGETIVTWSMRRSLAATGAQHKLDTIRHERMQTRQKECGAVDEPIIVCFPGNLGNLRFKPSFPRLSTAELVKRESKLILRLLIAKQNG